MCRDCNSRVLFVVCRYLEFEIGATARSSVLLGTAGNSGAATYLAEIHWGAQRRSCRTELRDTKNSMSFVSLAWRVCLVKRAPKLFAEVYYNQNFASMQFCINACNAVKLTQLDPLPTVHIPSFGTYNGSGYFLKYNCS